MLFYLLIFIMFAAKTIGGTLDDYTITATPSKVNEPSQHEWSLTYLTSADRQSFTLSYSSCMQISDPATITDSLIPANTISITSQTETSITFQIIGTTSNRKDYNFVINEVTNCGYSN